MEVPAHMPDDYSNLIILALVWLAYFVLHSLLASLRAKHWVARRMSSLVPLYRAGFNIIAIGSIVPPLWLMHAYGGDMVWEWRGPGLYIVNTLGALAVIGFFWSLKYYDGMDFLGLRQLKSGNRVVEDQEKFCISPLHRVVRHPWYFLALVIIWTRDMDSAFLLSAVCMTLYFIIGSWQEERKLVVYHGEIYRLYKTFVPGLFPLPWRYLDDINLKELLSNNNNKLEND